MKHPYDDHRPSYKIQIIVDVYAAIDKALAAFTSSREEMAGYARRRIDGDAVREGRRVVGSSRSRTEE